MVKVNSRSEEREKAKKILTNLERISRETFPQCLIKNSTSSNFLKGLVYGFNVCTQGITTVPQIQSNEVEVEYSQGNLDLNIYDGRAYEDALRLAQAYENNTGIEVCLKTP